jgi:hypothetical protein
MSANRAFSGKSAEPTVIEPGPAGRDVPLPDGADAPLDADVLALDPEPDLQPLELDEPPLLAAVVVLPPLDELPLLPHAARARTAPSRTAGSPGRVRMRFMRYLLVEVSSDG